MPVYNVLLFAGLKEVIGLPSLEIELPAGATVDALRARVGQLYPAVDPLLPTTVCAVNEEYVDPDHRLSEGDTVALIPPVSGGAFGHL